MEKFNGLKISGAIGSGMVFQRGKPIKVWGSADEEHNGKTIGGCFGGVCTSCEIENGRWTLTFPPINEPVRDGLSLTVEFGRDKYRFEDILIGDVYYVTGQSNAYWRFDIYYQNIKNQDDDRGVDDIIRESEKMKIRFFRNSYMYYLDNTGEDEQGTVKIFEDTAPEAEWREPLGRYDDFSALGYLFAYYYSLKSNVPVGMIEVDASGYPLTTFAPNELCDKWQSDQDDGRGVYYMALDGVRNHLKSRFAYNQQFYPLFNLSTSGVLWYQGESDAENTELARGREVYTFSYELPELIGYYREKMRDRDVPFYLVEFTPVYKVPVDGMPLQFIDTGCVRSELGTVPSKVADTFIVPSGDLWTDDTYYNNIHPYCKAEQAERCAAYALARRGYADSTVFAPTFEKCEYSEDGRSAAVYFRYAENGISTYNGEPVKGVQARINGEWTDAQARICGDHLVVSSDDEITGVRYFALTETNYPRDINLVGGGGIPLPAFADYIK
ncbi:MAG: hypothetical protein IJT91_01110 [Clostridia bacterium]|nr:hypothetical protein [Clostridia bacterium]